MKRFLFALLGAVIALQLVPVTVSAGVNNFYISDYDITFQLGKNADDRSILTTQETITAVFPQTNQSHGLERAIPTRYDGHTTNLRLLSVKDENGSTLPYSTSEQNDNLVVRIGEGDKYVHGVKTYVLAYQQQDVTRYFADTGRDEFYWDVNGDQWAVPIKRLTVQVSIDGIIAARLTGDMACYQGATGATDRCTLKNDNGVLSTSAVNLTPGQTVTLAVGFKPSTFSTYQPSLWEQLAAVWMIMTILTTFLAISLVTWWGIRYYRQSNRVAERSTIIPEYLPPKDISVTAASAIAHGARATFTAQLLDFAVRHYIKIYQTAEKKWARPAKYELEITKDIGDLSVEEKDLLKDIFGETAVGTRLELESLRSNFKVAINMRNNAEILQQQVREGYKLRAKVTAKSAWFYRVGFITLGAALITLSPGLLIAAATTFILGLTLYPLTDKGLVLYRYLEGLKMYIKVAETERLKLLQSPEGAARLDVVVDTKNPHQLIKLYERVLPYAVLFGEEKEWNKQIGAYYESAKMQPDWYAGRGAFNAVMFSTAMSNFATAASYTTASSSSAGGSGGGGSAGGGGGGGGGGGW